MGTRLDPSSDSRLMTKCGQISPGQLALLPEINVICLTLPLPLQGRPIFVFSTMSGHTRDIMEDPRCTLTVTAQDFKGAADARVSLTGSATPTFPAQAMSDPGVLHKTEVLSLLPPVTSTFFMSSGSHLIEDMFAVTPRPAHPPPSLQSPGTSASFPQRSFRRRGSFILESTRMHSGCAERTFARSSGLTMDGHAFISHPSALFTPSLPA